MKELSSARKFLWSKEHKIKIHCNEGIKNIIEV